MLNHPVPGRLRRGTGAALALALAVGTGLVAASGNVQDTIPIADPGASHARMSPPRYPQEAIDAKLAGTVVLRVLVGRDGAPKEVAIEQSAAGGAFDQVSIDAARSWQFNPARRDGQPVEGWVLVPITFSLDEEPPAEPVEGALDTLSVKPASG